MSLHRAVVFALVLICGAVRPSADLYAATAATGTISTHGSTTGVVQNNGSINVMAIRSGGSSGTASVVCSTANISAVAGRDYTAVNTTLHWANGDGAPKYCTIPISDATPFQGQKTFMTRFTSASGATLGASQNTVTIYGNKGGGTVSVSAPTYSVTQSTGNATVTVNRAGGSNGTAAVFYATANATAIAGTDYTPKSGMLLWQNGDATPKSIIIPISNAKAFAGSKTLAVALAHPENVVFGTPTSAIVTINGSSAGGTAKPTVSLTASPSNVMSGGATTLNWSSSNATACTASGGWTGSEPMSGSKTTGALSANQTYMLNCTGPGGTAAQSASVAVNTPPPTTPATASCTGTSGALKLNASVVRASGISPLLAFFDATGTTDSSISANTTTFQNVTYTWNFGDTGASGTDTWSHGANAGRNSRNTATGGVAAHLYVTPGADSAYTVTVTAHDGANTASCQLGVTAHEPSGASGFPGSATTCVASSGTPVAGSGGCPAGAAVQSSSSFVSALSAHMGNGKRVLFKCGDTFSGTNYTISATKASIGAYGGCEGTTTNRPVLQASAGNSTMFGIGTSSGDIRITDLVFDGGGQSIVTVFDTSGSINSNHPYQYTFYNLDAKRHVYSWRWAAGAQMGLIDSVAEAQTATPYINVFPNYAGTGGSWVSTGTVPNEDYLFFAGNSFTNGAPGNASYEVMRNSYASKNIISNNTMTNAGPSYATLKLHNLNYATNGGSGAWSGTYSQYDVISDNYFAGSSGANLVEISPQNAQSDERLRYIVIERNLFAGSEGYGRQLAVSGSNITVRDNVFHNASGSYGVQVAERGIEPVPQFVQVYNNTCYGGGSSACVAFNAMGNRAAGINSWALNNLLYNSGAVANAGSGNTVSNNTAATGSNPGFANGSGNFSLISDFRPTANYSGATGVPVLYDALGTAWAPTWDLGAVHP